jgi:hypothetical protein
MYTAPRAPTCHPVPLWYIFSPFFDIVVAVVVVSARLAAHSSIVCCVSFLIFRSDIEVRHTHTNPQHGARQRRYNPLSPLFWFRFEKKRNGDVINWFGGKYQNKNLEKEPGALRDLFSLLGRVPLRVISRLLRRHSKEWELRELLFFPEILIDVEMVLEMESSCYTFIHTL